MKEQYGISENSFNQNVLRNHLKSDITTQRLKRTFGNIVKKTLEKPGDNTKPDFDENTCREYFCKSYKKHSKPNYNFQTWM